tara:strand:+ start:4064 stop:4642 length:579 start_codon:yes stop_codon:yes gene_type:complete
MWPLLILSITNLSCIFERFSYWNRVKNIDSKQLNEIIEKYSTKNFSSNKINISEIPLEKVLRKTILICAENKNNIDIALSISLKSLEAEFNRFNTLFSTTVTVAPLLGLLGTVLGLINSFAFIKLGAAGINADQVTGGISEALVSTAAGLIVAIVTLVFLNYFSGIKRKEMQKIYEYAGYFEIIHNKQKVVK